MRPPSIPSSHGVPLPTDLFRRERIPVLLIATRLPLHAGDGTPSFVLDNASALRDEFDITILAPRVRGAPRIDTSGGVRVHRFAYWPRRWERLADEAIMPQLGRSPGLWLQAGSLVIAMTIAGARIALTTRPKLLHAQWVIPSGLVALLINALLGIPYIVTAQGADAFLLNGKFLRRLKRRIILRANRFIVVSRDLVETGLAMEVNATVQPSGVDFSLWANLVGHRKPDGKTVLFVGRLAGKKGVNLLIRAVKELPRSRLVIIGDGPERDELQRLTRRLEIEERVIFMGKRSRTAIAQEMKSATCLAIPSVTAPDGDRDGTPNVLGEAVAAGVPVVASRIAGLDEFLIDRHSGLLHEAGSIAMLKNCLEEILRDEELGARIAATAAQELAPVLDLPLVAARYARWYRTEEAEG